MSYSLTVRATTERSSIIARVLPAQLYVPYTALVRIHSMGNMRKRLRTGGERDIGCSVQNEFWSGGPTIKDEVVGMDEVTLV